MSAPDMLHTATLLFVLAALGGLVMAGIRFVGRRNPPSWLAMAHGLLAAAGLTLLLYAIYAGTVPATAVWAAVLFVIAAVGGVVLNLVYHLKGRPLPAGLTVGHAALAVAGFGALLTAAYG